jgi:hypothetical protein
MEHIATEHRGESRLFEFGEFREEVETFDLGFQQIQRVQQVLMRSALSAPPAQSARSALALKILSGTR